VGISQHMSLFMKKALENKSFDYLKYEEIFSTLFTLLNQTPLTKAIFRQQEGGQFATSLYDVITIGVSENYSLYEDNPKEILNKIDNEVRKDEILRKFSRKGGNNQQKRIINRLKEARRIFGNQ